MKRVVAMGALLVVSAIVAMGCSPAATPPATPPASPSATEAAMSPATPTAGLPPRATVVTSATLAADYYRGTYAHTTLTPTNGWSWSTYAQGVQALYRQSGDQRYLDDGMEWGRSNAWDIATPQQETNPDTIKAGETYADLNAIDPTASLAVMDAAMAKDLTGLPFSRYDWIDALFMGLPIWSRWATRTGDPAYLDKLDALYAWELTQGGTSSRCAGTIVPQTGLFDASQGLWYRDCTFVGAKDVNGQPVFWGRGNGWVIAAMAQVLESLPAGDPRGRTYAGMLQTMAARLVQLQGTDGFWRASLADPAPYPQPETSGTSLITYALAYGITAGILDAPTYLPAVVRAWDGLTRTALQPSGFVSSCQGTGVEPGPSYPATAPRTAPTATSSGTVNADSPPFCVGAFLLAGSAVAQLTSSTQVPNPASRPS
jgi:rhamnogalacturonyl hydrolase YesR